MFAHPRAWMAAAVVLGLLAGTVGVLRLTAPPNPIIQTFAGDCPPDSDPVLCRAAGDVGPAAKAVLSRPTSVAVDSTGIIFIADSANGRIREVDRGYYVAGHRTPSIAESRENFRISARRVYEIKNGELGQLYRDGGIAADSRDYLMNVDAVGTDFRLYPIPNCGKGQPMQTKKLGNGGPTMRTRARVLGG